MTTFQALIYTLIHSFTDIFPLGSGAIQILVSQATGWSPPPLMMTGMMNLGIALAILLYFIHDWLSMISSLLQVFIYRKKPMTMDERIPFFLLITTLPAAIGWLHFHKTIEQQLDLSLPLVSGSIIVFGALFSAANYLSRNNKNMYDWNILDSILVGATQLALFIPGCGRMMASILGGTLRNYSREATVKYSLFTGMPILFVMAAEQLKGFQFQAESPVPDTSWLTLSTTFAVAVGASLLTLNMLIKHVQKNSLNQVVWLRILAGLAGFALAFFHS